MIHIFNSGVDAVAEEFDRRAYNMMKCIRLIEGGHKWKGKDLLVAKCRETHENFVNSARIARSLRKEA